MVALFAASNVTSAQSSKQSGDAERVVRVVFDKWSTALTRGDKKSYLDTF